MEKVFVYGSLLNPASAERALARPLHPGDMTAARLPGYRLAWNSIHLIHAEQAAQTRPASFLNIELAEGCEVFGQIIRVGDDEFERLCQREKGYAVPRLTCLDDSGQQHIAHAFVDERPSPDSHPALAGYLAKIEAGLARLGPEFRQRYLANLPPPPGPLIDGPYHFVDETQRQLT